MEGISFIVRARNEARTLERCLRSLQGLRIPYEIILVLHRTTDSSRAIAETLIAEDMPIFVFRYDHELSRAGYETLVTDANSPHSMCTYSRWCFDKGMFPWKFRWDADFVASSALISKLNARDWRAPKHTTRIRIPAVSSTSRNEECYLFAGAYEYRKYIFWEYTEFLGEQTGYEHWPDVEITHASELVDKKSYWLERPWFETEQSEEAWTVRTRYAALVSVCGTEPNAQARASNPESDPVFWRVQNAEKELEIAGISFSR